MKKVLRRGSSSDHHHFSLKSELLWLQSLAIILFRNPEVRTRPGESPQRSVRTDTTRSFFLSICKCSRFIRAFWLSVYLIFEFDFRSVSRSPQFIFCVLSSFPLESYGRAHLFNSLSTFISKTCPIYCRYSQYRIVASHESICSRNKPKGCPFWWWLTELCLGSFVWFLV